LKVLLSIFDPLSEGSFLDDFLDLMNVLSELTDAMLMSRTLLGPSPVQMSIPDCLLSVGATWLSEKLRHFLTGLV
jgi:hypothetical protein